MLLLCAIAAVSFFLAEGVKACSCFPRTSRSSAEISPPAGEVVPKDPVPEKPRTEKQIFDQNLADAQNLLRRSSERLGLHSERESEPVEVASGWRRCFRGYQCGVDLPNMFVNIECVEFFCGVF